MIALYRSALGVNIQSLLFIGKTVQTVSICEYLHRAQRYRGPFLIIAPLSTLPHWQREFENWTEMNVLVYHGSAAAREIIRDYEWWYYQSNNSTYGRDLQKFNVLITTYEVLLADEKLLSKFKWRYVCYFIVSFH